MTPAIVRRTNGEPAYVNAPPRMRGIHSEWLAKHRPASPDQSFSTDARVGTGNGEKL